MKYLLAIIPISTACVGFGYYISTIKRVVAKSSDGKQNVTCWLKPSHKFWFQPKQITWEQFITTEKEHLNTKIKELEKYQTMLKNIDHQDVDTSRITIN
uniref:Uncharacterized protein n=1 Tax=Marseillevirus LCMAC201 TaxID=2506605 RepID=A0A481YX85_9VIRU|nr:MAG: hypothetical protein LCMAC201_05530 [Marseillevirus LCMAC201]